MEENNLNEESQMRDEAKDEKKKGGGCSSGTGVGVDTY